MFIPSTAASYDGIPPDKTGQASALINAARNTGRSIGISLISAKPQAASEWSWAITLPWREEDLGRDVAMKVAGQLVMFFKRPGSQMQFSRTGESLPAGRSILQEVQ